ncbi:MAG: hypothetical protein ACXQS8_02215, partial [Candidatus Helarchaeales archaeon]
MSRKYAEDLSNYFRNSRDWNSLNYIAREFLELMRQKCENCMKYRIECALQPHCENRKYINVLVNLGVKHGDLPAFCYTQHKRNIENYLKGKPFIVKVEDSKIYLKDFLEIIGEKKLIKKNPKEILEGIDAKLSKMDERYAS